MNNEFYMFERDLLAALLETLKQLPHVHVQPPSLERQTVREKYQLDAEIHLDAAGRSLTLFVEVRKSAYPRDIRQIIWNLNRFGRREQLNRQEEKAIPLLAAESLSPGAKDLLRKQDIGYFDTGGSLYIPARGAFFYIDRPVPKTFEKSVRSLFTGKRSQVLQTLMMARGEWHGVKEVAELAKVSPATASETLTALERFDWVISRGQGPSKERCLANPGALLDEWSKQARHRRPRPARRYYVPATDPEELMKRLSRLSARYEIECAMTQEAAAQRYAPFLSAVSRVACRMMPGRAADVILNELDARSVSDGANLHVIETTSLGAFLFKEWTGGVWLANPIQVYLDLLHGNGRSTEMAEHLRRERIGF